MVRHGLPPSRPKRWTHEQSARDRTPSPPRLEDKLPVSGYSIKVMTASAPTRVLTTDAAAAEATVDALLPDTEYTFQVAAVNLSGVGDFSSASESVTTGGGAWCLPRWVVALAAVSRLLLQAEMRAPTLWVARLAPDTVDLQWESEPRAVSWVVLQSTAASGRSWTPVFHGDAGASCVC